MNPESVEQFLKDQYYYHCPHCQQTVHLVRTMIINCPNGMFSMKNDAAYELKKAALIKYGYFDADGKKKWTPWDRFWDAADEKRKAEPFNGRDQKKNRDRLKKLIFLFYSALRSKKNRELEIDLSDWKEYDKIALTISKEIEREQENFYLHPPGESTVPLEKDEPLMEEWEKIKAIMTPQLRKKLAKEDEDAGKKGGPSIMDSLKRMVKQAKEDEDPGQSIMDSLKRHFQPD